MRIVLDTFLGPNGDIVGEVIVHTEVTPTNKSLHPDGVSGQVDVITVLKFLHTALPAVLARTGWDKLSDHPAHKGKTLIQVLRDEIIRLNDVPARTALRI